MSVLSRWQAKLKGRRQLLDEAEHELAVAKPKDLAGARAKVTMRKTQVAYALRVVKRHLMTDVRINGNVVTGGTARQRVVAAMDRSAYLYAIGKRPSFYSQPGRFDATHGITGEPQGERSDCSQWATAMHWSAGLPDPNMLNYGGGNTGTLAAHGTYIQRSQLQPGDNIFYGPAPHHHVEKYRGPWPKTIGHGTRAVDAGTVTMMPEIHYSRPHGL